MKRSDIKSAFTESFFLFQVMLSLVLALYFLDYSSTAVFLFSVLLFI